MEKLAKNQRPRRPLPEGMYFIELPSVRVQKKETRKLARAILKQPVRKEVRQLASEYLAQ